MPNQMPPRGRFRKRNLKHAKECSIQQRRGFACGVCRWKRRFGCSRNSAVSAARFESGFRERDGQGQHWRGPHSHGGFLKMIVCESGGHANGLTCFIFRFLRRPQARAARAEKASPQLLLLDGFKKPTNLVASSGRQLAWRRLEDLRKLAELRGGVQEGQRMLHMFWQLNFLLLAGATNSSQMWHEALELGRQIGGGSWIWQKGELSTLYRKSQMFAMGDKVKFAGREWPALYTPKSSTLIDLFGVTDTEMRQLRTIVSSAETARRHRSRQEARRRAAGAVSREEYLGQSQNKQERALALREQGLSVRAIAEALEISKSAVARYLASPQDECPRSCVLLVA